MTPFLQTDNQEKSKCKKMDVQEKLLLSVKNREKRWNLKIHFTVLNRLIFFIITHKCENFYLFRKFHICERKLIFAFENIVSVLG